MSEYIYQFSFQNKKNKGALWYIIALSIVIGLVVWGFLTKQYVMGFMIILVSGVYFFIENNSEEEVQVFFSLFGIKINTQFYEYSKIDSFTIFYDDEIATTLRLHIKKGGMAYLDLKIDNQVAYDLKQFLVNYLPEDDTHEKNFTDKIISLLKL